MKLGIDIGGTKILAALIENGAAVRHLQEPVNKEALIPQIIRLAQALGGAPTALGVGIAGQVENGVLLASPNLNLRHIPLQTELEKALNLPTKVLNDVQAAALAEWQLGAGQNCHNLVVALLGTGIGGALIVHNHLLTGTAGEIGHMVIHQNGLPCSCGQKGCLEPYAAGWGLANRAHKPSALDLTVGDQLIIEEGFNALVTAFSNLANLLNPEKIILGGGLLPAYQKFYPHFLSDLQTRIKTQALPGNRVQLEPARLEGFSVVIGSTLNFES